MNDKEKLRRIDDALNVRGTENLLSLTEDQIQAMIITRITKIINSK